MVKCGRPDWLGCNRPETNAGTEALSQQIHSLVDANIVLGQMLSFCWPSEQVQRVVIMLASQRVSKLTFCKESGLWKSWDVLWAKICPRFGLCLKNGQKSLQVQCTKSCVLAHLVLKTWRANHVHPTLSETQFWEGKPKQHAALLKYIWSESLRSWLHTVRSMWNRAKT